MSSSACQRELLKLTRLAHNRLCADCKVPLGEHRILASLAFRVFICDLCGEQHTLVLGHKAQIKVAVGEGATAWSEAEVSLMQDAGHNVTVNNTIERFVPQEWKKLSPNSTAEERKRWISAKYDVLYFSFPDGLNYTALQQQQLRLGTKKKVGKKGKGCKDEAVLPIRIADFFLTVGPGECKQYGQNFQTRSFIKGGSADTPATPADISFKPTVVNCCPPESEYSDMDLPEFLAPCVFPCDLKLSAVDCPPYSFTFVLTNASGIKLYGAVLHVYEIVEPDDLARMLGHPVGSNKLPNWPIVYIPKALTVVSHYPFYTTFTGFLRNIYHISLSNAPMPIERYVINFLQEVPLPPPGRVDIRYFMPNNLKIIVSRPPPNKLPMVDFSYRPLFACLSVENIIIVFQCLCAELTVCICSDNLSLLTPVQEAFLSFLFPLVWQGCYIPVMPLNMVEILDAPVPFLIGIHSQYLTTTPRERRPQGVVFVDLQKDEVDLGSTSELYGTELTPRVVEPLSKQIRLKLKAKLNEFGGCIYRQKNHMDKLKTAGVAFPFHEQLNPIIDFQSNSAMSQSDHASRPPSPPHHISPQYLSPNYSPSKGPRSPQSPELQQSKLYESGDIKPSLNFTVLEKLLLSKVAGGAKFIGNGKAVSNGTKDPSTVRSSAYGLHQLAHAPQGDILASSVVTPPVESILDPLNNTPVGYACIAATSWASSTPEEGQISGTFDALEIRNAFLRVFVVLLTEFVECYTAAAVATAIAPMNVQNSNGNNGNNGNGNSSGSINGSSHDTANCSTGSLTVASTAMIPYSSDSLRVKDTVSMINRKNSNSSISSTASSTFEGSRKRLTFLKLGLNKPKILMDDNEKKPLGLLRKAPDLSPGIIGAPYDHDNFLKGQKDKFLRQLLETQMFASFEEECRATPHPTQRDKSSEVTFFEESILAKKNRSALSYKSFTPFLSDTSNDIIESFTAPEPTGWGLIPTPSPGSTSITPTENTFSYQQFPLLSPSLFGPVRPARVLLHKPEKGRQLSQSSKVLQETIEMRTRSLTRVESNKSVVGAAAKKQAMKERMSVAKTRNLRAMQSIIKFQSLFRMLKPRRLFIAELMAIRTIQRSYRMFAAKCVRSQATSRRDMATYVRWVVRVQAVWRMAARRRVFRLFRTAVTKLQSRNRRRTLRDQYVRMRSAIIKVETRVRAWLVDRQENWNRAIMARCLIGDIVLLWEREYTPLTYRSKFFLMIDGNSYLHLALYEEERKRLIESLGGRYVRTQLITGRPKKNCPIMNAMNRSGLNLVNPSAGKSFRWSNKGENSPSRNPLINLGKPKIDTTYNNANLRLDSMERISIIGVPARLSPQVEARLAISLIMLKEERREMYLKLRSSTADSIRDSLFNMFDFEKRMKRRKQTLSALVWTSREEMHLVQSAQAVLALSACTSSVKGKKGSQPALTGVSGGGHSEWLNAKLRSRVQSACVESVRACMMSLQHQRTRELEERKRRGLEERKRREAEREGERGERREGDGGERKRREGERGEGGVVQRIHEKPKGKLKLVPPSSLQGP